MSEEPLIAVFVDFENLAIGVRGMKGGDFRIQLVLKRLLEKGRIVYKRAYCDWSHYRDTVREFHGQGIELIDVPQTRMSGKNSADIRMVVDALDLCYSKEHIDTFALLSGDSDFSPLVSKLKENGKHVIGLGMKESTSDLLSDNCDEFIFYEDLEKQAMPAAPGPKVKDIPQEKKEIFDLLLESIAALIRENKDPIFASMVKDTMQRKRPSFSESAYGYRSFSSLLQDAEKRQLIKLHREKKAGGTYVVEGFVE